MPSKPGLIERARAAGRRALEKLTGKNQRPNLPPSPFQDWEFDDASGAVEEAIDAQTIDTSGDQAVTPSPGDAAFANPRQQQNPIEMNRAFFQGDHWQGGAGWIGPHPQSGETGFSDAMREIALAFTSQNAIREVTKRHGAGVVGKAWQWAFVPRRSLKKDEEPSDQEQAAIEEVTAIVRNWIEARKISALIKNAIYTLLLSERAALRLYVPAGLAEEGEGGLSMVTAGSIEEALALVWADHPMPEFAAVVQDADTKLECGVWLFEQQGESEDDKPEDWAGLTFLDESGLTVMRLVPQKSGEIPPIEASLDLGGRISMFEMHRTAIVTPQVQQSQRALNLALSMIPRNVISGGFLERALLGAQMPGRYEADGKGGQRFIPDPLYVGAGTTNFYAGQEAENADGTKTIASPSIQWREPIEPKASMSAADKHYRSILEETGQLHVIMSGDAEASGVSRVEARAEYLNTLQETQPEAESAIRFIIETALAIAEALANKPGFYTSQLRVQAQCRLDAGPLSPDERRAVQEQIGKTISQDTAMAMLGVDDAEAERARMMADPQARAALGLSIGQALQALTTAGASLEGAALFLGISQEQIDQLMTPATFDEGDGTDDGDGADAEDIADEEDDAANPKPPAPGNPKPKTGAPPARAGSSAGGSAGGE